MRAGPTLRSLPSLLDAALGPHGFVRARGSKRWQRVSGASEQVVGLRRSRTGEGRSALYIAEQAPGVEPEQSFELSPVAPLSNTYWWSDEPSDHEAQALQAQVTQVVLPFFAAPAPDLDQTQLQVQAPLAPLRDARPAFCLGDDGTWWRLRGRVIDLVIPETLAQHRFVRPWVAVWHQDLPHGLAGSVPEGVTHAAAHTLGRDGVDGDALAALYALHGPDGWATSGPQWLAAALAWFETLHSTADVLAQVRDEYRASMSGGA